MPAPARAARFAARAGRAHTSMGLTRRLLVGRMLAGAAVLAGVRAPGGRAAASAVSQLSVRNASRSFVGDRRRFATISPRSGNGRARAVVDLVADRPVDATLEVVSRNRVGATLVSREPISLAAGRNADPVGAAPVAETRLLHPPAAASSTGPRRRCSAPPSSV